ncbi:transmembrane protease serine 9-like isoform X2 [Armigeres subalbatus]|uniref:transmembrane protease serine 9-like isoform X2 n=1 Tax=Armigeres subalbatus TaxID=124917 RepID=UPI002ED1E1EF
MFHAYAAVIFAIGFLLRAIAFAAADDPPSCDLLFSPVRCGVPKLQLSGGALPSRAAETIRGEFPWQAALYQEEDGNFSYACGGSLISDRFVLTAAHCVINPNNGFKLAVGRLKVTLGAHELGVEDECVQNVRVRKIFVYPEYNMDHFKHDLALVELYGRVVFTNRVLPICVDMSDHENDGFYRQHGKVPGWGYTEIDALSNWLRMTELPFVNYTTCLASNPAVFSNTIYEGMFCAGFANGSSVCNGDSGGGLITYQRDHWMLKGIVSFTALKDGPQNVCDSKEYTGFVKVRYYREWLKNVTEQGQMYKEENFTEAPSAKKTEALEDFEEKQEPCGERKINKQGLIVNGVRSYAGEWPWHVAVYEMNGRQKRYICGGTLISDQFVMTAAHCLLDDTLQRRSGTIVVQLGQNNLYESSVHMREVLVGKITPHEAFDPLSKVNDIALLELTSTVQFNDYIQPVCLPSKNDLVDPNPVGEMGSIVGWGYEQPWSFMISNLLLGTKLPVVDVAKCAIGKNFGVDTNGVICMGSANDANACTGDSGGGMFFEKNGVWTVRGVISALDTVDGFCNPNGFLKLTDTKYFFTWIKKVVQDAVKIVTGGNDREMTFLHSGTNYVTTPGLDVTGPSKPPYGTYTEIHHHHHHYYPQQPGDQQQHDSDCKRGGDSSSESNESGALTKIFKKKKCFIKDLTGTLLSKLF